MVPPGFLSIRSSRVGPDVPPPFVLLFPRGSLASVSSSQVGPGVPPPWPPSGFLGLSSSRVGLGSAPPLILEGAKSNTLQSRSGWSNNQYIIRVIQINE